MACTPTGPELCFNAIDDNCNGVIDEGCGVGTGVLQFTIAWNEAAADVDLSVVDPGKSTVQTRSARRRWGSGPIATAPESQSASESCGGQNTENIFFEGLEPPRGRYVVNVHLEDPHGAPTPILDHFGARVGATTYSAELSLSPGDPPDRHKFTFDL